MSPDSRAVRVAVLSALVFFAAAAFAGRQVGLTTDERLHQEHGRRLWNFYSSLGHDQNVLNLRNLRYYGGLFDIAGESLHRVTGARDRLAVRHLLCAAFGSVGVLFTCLIASRVVHPNAGALAGAMLGLTPRWFGGAMFDSKDIPFAAGYVAALYFLVRLAERAPRPTTSDWMKFGVAAGFAMSVRIGGLLLLAISPLAIALARHRTDNLPAVRPWHQDRLPGQALRCGLALLVAYGIALPFWPYLLKAPIGHLLEVVRMSAHFEWNNVQLFRGEWLRPAEIGRWYLPVWLWVSTPPVLLVGLGLAATSLTARSPISPAGRPAAVIVALAGLIPILLPIALKSVLYDGVRHLLFVFPPLTVLATLGWTRVICRFPRRSLFAAASTILLVAGLAEPTAWLIRSQPFQYAYFSPQAGGFVRASHLFQSDYWYVSSLEAARALDRLASRLPPGETLSVNCQNYFLVSPQLAPTTRSRVALHRLDTAPETDVELLFSDKILRRSGKSEGEVLYEDRIADGQVPFAVIRRSQRSDDPGEPSLATP